MDISIVVPVYNESENIDLLFKTLDEYFLSCDYINNPECIFVDDGSSDDTYEKMKAQNAEHYDIKIIKLSKNCGSHGAIRAGVLNAKGKYTMFFSADLQEPVDLIGDVYKKLEEGYDAVYVQKGATEVKMTEKCFSRLYAKFMKKYVSKNFPIGGINNIGFNNKIKENFNSDIQKNSSVFLQIVNMGYKFDIITKDYAKRNAGESKWTFGAKIKMIIDSFIAFSYVPIRFITGTGMILSFAGVLWALIILILKITGLFEFDAGYPSLIAILLFGFGITNVSLGIIAEYIWRTMDISKKQPLFIIDNIVEIKK